MMRKALFGITTLILFGAVLCAADANGKWTAQVSARSGQIRDVTFVLKASGSNFFTIEHLAIEGARKAAAEISVLVAPTLPFGSSDHHLAFGGTFSLGTEVYYRVVCDLLRSLVQDGFKRILLLNGHGGNHELIQLAARDIALSHTVEIAAASYWMLGWDGLLALNAHLGCRLPGHAGKFETSVMLALRESLVSSKLPQREYRSDTDPRGAYGLYRHERHGSWQAIDGYSDSPARASAALGREYLPVIIDAVAQTLIRVYQTGGV
jgi:creatinine amidohydrolase